MDGEPIRHPIPANTTFDVPSGVTQSVWVSFTVAKDSIPGKNITGEISLFSTSKILFKIPFNLQVSNVTLPSLFQRVRLEQHGLDRGHPQHLSLTTTHHLIGTNRRTSGTMKTHC